MMTDSTLYYGDNLDILRRYVKDETVDLIHLDPPFKSGEGCNVLEPRARSHHSWERPVNITGGT